MLDGEDMICRPPPYVVLVERVDDIEDLKNWAYGVANAHNYPTTEHWDEPKQSATAFCFKEYGAAWSFMALCKGLDIPCKVNWGASPPSPVQPQSS
jgi:hypothetical protein